MRTKVHAGMSVMRVELTELIRVGIWIFDFSVSRSGF
jgi:hypothetical protein